jgi:hypothetical protein
MTEIIDSSALDKLDRDGEFHESSYSRTGGFPRVHTKQRAPKDLGKGTGC